MKLKINDKVLHFSVCFLLGFCTLLGAKLLHGGVIWAPISAFGPLLIGLGKEIFDWVRFKKTKPDPKSEAYVNKRWGCLLDFFADFMGTCFGVFLSALVIVVFNL